MALKRSEFVRTGSLAVNNAAIVNSAKLNADQKTALQTLVAVLAELLDAVGNGEVTHVTIGTPRSRESFLVTVNNPDGTKQYAGFSDIVDMGPRLAEDLLV